MRPAFTLTGGGIQALSVPCGRQANTGAASSLAGELVEHLKLLLQSAISPSSRRTYQRAWTVYAKFAEQFSLSDTLSLPLSVNSVALFIAHLSAKRLARATISTYISAISYVHKLKGYADPTKVFLILKLLAAIKSRSRPDIRLPITLPVLRLLVEALKQTSSSFYHRTLFTAMFLTAFYGFLRIGEITCKTTSSGSSVLQHQNLSFLLHEGEVIAAKLTLTNFKHNRSGRPFYIHILRQQGSEYCPVQALQSFCTLRGSRSGPLFTLADGSSVSTHHFSQALNQCLTFCGRDNSHYKPHSFRIGAASFAADQGFTDSQIRGLGRWKSDAFKVYLRSSSLVAPSDNK